MQAVLLYRKQVGEATSFEFNVFDNQFATENLAVRKVLMSMLEAVRPRLTELEVEYNDSMLIEKLGVRRAGELLRFLGSTKENTHEEKSQGIVVSRSFRSPITEERYQYFYEMKDIAELPHYRLQEGQEDRIVFYFSRYLQLIAPDQEAASAFISGLEAFTLPYKLVDLK